MYDGFNAKAQEQPFNAKNAKIAKLRSLGLCVFQFSLALCISGAGQPKQSGNHSIQ